MAAERKKGQPLDPKIKHRAAELIGMGLTWVESAGACAISERTIERIMQDPAYRKVSDDTRKKRTSMSSQVAEVLRELVEATDANGDPNMALRQRGAELYAKAPEMFDIVDEDGEDALLPGVVLRFPHPAIPDPSAFVEFAPED